jgi:hypothetical protein
MSNNLMQLSLDVMERYQKKSGDFDRFADEITALRQELSKPEQEPVAWRNAAIRLGEDLYSVGPNGYYDMTAKQWLDWALGVVNTAPPKREQEPVCDKDPHLCGFVQCQLGKVCKNTIVGQFVGGIPEVSQQREWVGLTDDDCIEAQKNSWNEYKNGKELKFDGFKLCKNIEQILKEKNT